MFVPGFGGQYGAYGIATGTRLLSQFLEHRSYTILLGYTNTCPDARKTIEVEADDRPSHPRPNLDDLRRLEDGAKKDMSNFDQLNMHRIFSKCLQANFPDKLLDRLLLTLASEFRKKMRHGKHEAKLTMAGIKERDHVRRSSQQSEEVFRNAVRSSIRRYMVTEHLKSGLLQLGEAIRSSLYVPPMPPYFPYPGRSPDRAVSC
ncbi:hypothetical protein VDGL01_11226 [Verticillium dahliae]